MLLLTRKVDEEIIIGNDLMRIKLMQINGNQVRLGITAPRDLEIHRLEIYEKIKRGEIHQKMSNFNPFDIYDFESRN
jgi:carbon storage regulator